MHAVRLIINSVEVAYDDHGVGIPVIFLHAFPLNRHMWDGQVSALLDEQRFRLITLDWPGFGESVLSTDISTMESFADCIAGVMDALGIPQAILCGLSMGGYAAFAFLRKYPQRIRGLILSDTRPGADDETGKANRVRLAQVAETQGADAIADLQMSKLISEDTRQHHPAVEERVRQLISTASPQGIAAASRGMAQRQDATDLLSQIQFPTLVLVGEHDALTPPSVVQEYTKEISSARMAVIPHAGHLANLEQPDAFLAAIRSFLLTAV
ncbi:MAG TPA: alpha/beta fold hydrolase [Dictyobacter sp.]|jgi:pimeloyl-ACP methyl ester carboxylesterase|nr:alpha/beta fold hydrolase [Dictyobacter sp.]